MKGVYTTSFYYDFIDQLTPMFKLHGFEFHKPSSSFVRPFNEGRQYLNINRMGNGLYVSLELKVINLAVRDILEKVIDSKQGSHLATIWWHSLNYFQDEDYDRAKFFIIEQKEKNIGKENVKELLEKFALPLFDKHSDIKGIDTLVNDDNEYPLVPNKSHSTNTMLTIYTGLITAKLLNRSDFDRIARRNLSHLNRFEIETKDADMERFNVIDFDKYREKWGL